MKYHCMRALETLRSNAGLLTNSGLIAGGCILASGTGFLYWLFAAREFSPVLVGVQATLVSAMALVGMLGDAGFSTLMLGEASRRGRGTHSLMAAAALAGGGSALLLAVMAIGLFRFEWRMTGTDELLFVIGCALTGFGMVIDGSFIGLGHSRMQFVRSLIFSVVKLVLLVAAGLLLRNASVILFTWVVSLALSLVVSCGYASSAGVLELAVPDMRGLAKEIRVVIDHHLLNLAATASVLLMPLVVSACLGPAITAAFFAGWMLRNLIMLLPASLTTLLFSLDNSPPETMRRNLSFSLMVSLAISAAGLAAFVMFGNLMLRMFNASYPHLAGAAMPLLGISLISGTIRQHYVLLARVRRTMLAGSFWLALGGCAELGLATVGGLYGGVQWLAVGWVLGLTASAIFLARPLLAYLRPGWTGSGVSAAVSPIFDQGV